MVCAIKPVENTLGGLQPGKDRKLVFSGGAKYKKGSTGSKGG